MHDAAKQRRWRTPISLRPKGAFHKVATPVQDLDSSMMSLVSDSQGASPPAISPNKVVHINLSPTIQAEANEDRKRPKLMASAAQSRVKRMRVCFSATARKPIENVPIFHNASVREPFTKRLDFAAPREDERRAESIRSNTHDENLRIQYAVKLSELERKLQGLPFEEYAATETELMWLRHQISNDSELQARIGRLLHQLSESQRLQEKVSQLKERATQRYRENRYDEAERLYTEAIAADESKATLYSNRAAARIMMGRNMEAIADCDKALLLEPHFGKALARSARASLNLGDAFSTYSKLDKLMRLAHQKLFEDPSGDVQRSIVDLEGQLKLFTEFLKAGDDALTRDDPSVSRSIAMKALEIAPASLKARTLKIVSELLLALKIETGSVNAVGTALRDLEQSVGVAGFGEVYQYGMQLYARAFISESAALLVLAASWAPCEAEIARNCGLVRDIDNNLRKAKKLQEHNQFTGAIRMCEDAFALARCNTILCARILVLKANCMVLLGQARDAELECNRAIALDPTYFPVRIVRGSALMCMGAFDAAEQELLLLETKFGSELSRKHRDEIKRLREDIQVQRKTDNRRKQGGTAPVRRNQTGDDVENDISQFFAQKDKMNHYMVLGVHKNASREEIRRAYKCKALRFHPDKNSHPHAPEIFKRIVEAAGVVSSPNKRRMYDITLL